MPVTTHRERQATNLDKLVEQPKEKLDTTGMEEETEFDSASKGEGGKETFSMPEKFKGKSAEEIAQSYKELEQQYGSQGNALGQIRSEADELRRTVDNILQRELSRTAMTESDEPEKVEWDDMDPVASVTKIVQQALKDAPVNKNVQELTTAVQQTVAEKANERFATKHPDANQVVNTPEFQSWVMASPIRQQMFAEAYNHANVNCAIELLDTYKAIHSAPIQGKEQLDPDKAKQKQRVNRMTTETGSTGATSTKKYSRRYLIDLRATNPAEYKRRSAEFSRAYAEGRVVD